MTAPLLPELTDLCKLPDNELRHYDLAAVNLACAVGLPGAEVIDVSGCMNILDDWAKSIRNHTDRLLATEYRSKSHIYRNSVPLYRMVKLIQILKKFGGVQYDPKKRNAKPSDPFELHEHFIHGPIQGPGGTCWTLPLLYTAVARRLNYPVRLVVSREHVFCRWDDPVTGEKINIDGSGDDVSSQPDDYYRVWPMPLTEEQERLGGFLQSMTPRRELACSLSRRGIHWQECGNYRRAASTFLLSSTLDETLAPRAMLQQLVGKWSVSLKKIQPCGFPKVQINADILNRYWPRIPFELEAQLRLLDNTQMILEDEHHEKHWWAPLRSGTMPKSRVPAVITVTTTGGRQCLTQP